MQTVGEVLAARTARLLENRGRIVLITARGRMQQVQLDAFKKGLRQTQNLQIESVVYPSKRDMQEGAVFGGLSRKLFFDLLSNHMSAGAIVSLIGPPELSDDDLTKLPPKMPRIVVFAPLGMGVKRLLEAKVVELAVVPRMAVPYRDDQAGGTKRHGELFRSDVVPNSSTDPLLGSPFQLLTAEMDLSGYFEPPMPPRPRQPR
jgi:hypothetical protein